MKKNNKILKAILLNLLLISLSSLTYADSSSNTERFPPSSNTNQFEIQNNMTITELYAVNGISHFRELKIPATEKYIDNLFHSALFQAQGFEFISFPNHFEWKKHTPPKGSRYLELVIAGSEVITAGDGTTKTLKPGDCIYFNDANSSGHTASGQHGKSLVISLGS